ncbi:macrolide ABC transporter ATP-binding protein [Kitasatospora sp. MMS16-BH015]|uniref:ABC transporter ATP-binding protein n=1 Tax=Kitasatospora sp. MMS16-BH015 TaxID=2018025 RepID=UPI000CA2F628|nr:ABC transporter ATP-binding protein [Kitasatospora sp. MMS16-BH015]AUG82168.1 macrolide ABC transporter ATP-binding protein [Kitasatospora sp. MMS16-BH015]
MPVSPLETPAEEAASAATTEAAAAAAAEAAQSVPEGALLAARGLHKAFGPTPALNGASLHVMPGEMVSVMGSSGSGKSTLLHCLAGIVRPDQGSVTFRGEELTTGSDARRSELRLAEFGFVFQFGQLVPELPCVENVALPLRLRGAGRKAAQQQALGWLERLEVAELARKLPGEISGGQGQRVAIARAMVASPAVLFADEPTGALDSLQSEKVMSLLTAAARENDTAVVLVTHDVRVAAYADREVTVRDGRTVRPSSVHAGAWR